MTNTSDIWISLNIAYWERFPEVEEYAKCYSLTLNEAISELVNAGLSHIEVCL